VHAAVEHVEHRHGQEPGVHAAEVAVEGLTRAPRCGARDGQGDPEDGVGAEAGLVLRTVEFAECRVERGLLARGTSDDGGGDDVLDVRDGAGYPFATEAILVAITKLDGLARPGGRARRDRGAPEAAVAQTYIDFDRGIAPRVQDLTRMKARDGAQSLLLLAAVMFISSGGAVKPCAPADGAGPRAAFGIAEA
jgi:hypothetical protein